MILEAYQTVSDVFTNLSLLTHQTELLTTVAITTHILRKMLMQFVIEITCIFIEDIVS
jgi:hypothetical protein